MYTIEPFLIVKSTEIEKRKYVSLRKVQDHARGKRLRSEIFINLLNMLVEYSEDIYPYATFQLEESVPAGGDSRCNSAAPLQTFVYHDPRLSTADTLQLREVSSVSSIYIVARFVAAYSHSHRTFFRPNGIDTHFLIFISWYLFFTFFFFNNRKNQNFLHKTRIFGVKYWDLIIFVIRKFSYLYVL